MDRKAVPLKNQLQHAGNDEQSDQKNNRNYPKKYFHYHAG
jgi:hypothetical protein